jgi:hypothetical protein
MLRDLTKSMLSFSWGMSLFGAKQLVNSLTPEKATAAFNAVTQATEGQLGDVLKGAFRVGDQLQRGMVDMTFGLLTLEVFNPGQVMKMASDVMQQSTGAFTRPAQGGTMGSQERTTGWGPVPPSGARQGSQARPAGSEEGATGWGPIPPSGANRS